MVRSPPEDDPEPVDELDELFKDREEGPDGAPRTRPKGRPRVRPNRSVRVWRSADEIDDELDGGPPARRPPGATDRRPPRTSRARDSMFFEPLVALAIIVVLLVSLFAYTSNWPPIYVVESNSMQHGAGDHLGYLNAGDVVLAQKLSLGEIQPYFPAVVHGYSTYGEPGDVLLYHPNGVTSATPLVHRAIVYLVWNASSQTYSAPGLKGVPCGGGAGHPYYQTTGTTNECGTSGLSGQLTFFHVGWKDLTVTVDLTNSNCRQDLGGHSGFLTLGDNNTATDQLPANGCASPKISSLVEPGWVIGAARGMIPWFGALKLVLDGNSGYVPGTSWEMLGLSIAGLLLAGAGLHFLGRRLRAGRDPRRQEERRRAARRELEDEFLDDRPAGPVHAWRERPLDEESDPPARPRHSYEDRRRGHVSSRPAPNRPHGPPEPAPADETDGS